MDDKPRRSVGLWALLVSLIMVLDGCCNPPDNIGSQSVALRPQETSHVVLGPRAARVIMEFLGTQVQQGDEANKEFGRTGCLNSPVPNACVQGGWPEFDKYGFSFKRTSDTPLTWAQVKSADLLRQEPFALSPRWTGGGGHMMVVTDTRP